MLRAHAATWRVRPGRTATHTASGESQAEPSTIGAGRRTRRLTTGAATPAATRVQAAARMPLGTRKGPRVYAGVKTSDAPSLPSRARRRAPRLAQGAVDRMPRLARRGNR